MTDPMDSTPTPPPPGAHDPFAGLQVKEGDALELADGETMTPERVLEALHPIQDPEILISIVDLGLIYGVDVNEAGNHVTVRMTLTGPGCPVGPQILAAVHGTVAKQQGVTEPDVQLIWDPPWNPAVHANDAAKDILGIW
jgi:metal-sulfur cluster biosynthetic enzyme